MATGVDATELDRMPIELKLEPGQTLNVFSSPRYLYARLRCLEFESAPALLMIESLSIANEEQLATSGVQALTFSRIPLTLPIVRAASGCALVLCNREPHPCTVTVRFNYAELPPWPRR
jgi:hypothetical protein